MKEINDLNSTISQIISISNTEIITASLKEKLRKLEQIVYNINEKFKDIEFREPSKLDSDTVLKKFKKFYENKLDSSDFKIKELRILCFNINIPILKELSILNDKSIYNSFIKLIKEKWVDSFLISLYISSIKNWDEPFAPYLLEFIHQHISSYKGTIRRYLRIRNNIHYFLDTKGIDILVKEVIDEKIELNQLYSKLEIPQELLTSSYFSKFINKYYYKLNASNSISIEILDQFEDFLDHHNNRLTNKILIPKMIMNHQNDDIKLFDRIRDLTFDQIGDPANEAKWAVDRNLMNETAIQALKEARDILNRWLIQKFINVFFEICINDPDRKRYWLQYVDRINTFKVYGTFETKRLLKLDDRIKDFINSRFVMVDGNTNKSAFLMEINDYSLIEFGDSSNAFYAYKKNSAYRKAIDHNIEKLDELKFPKLPSLHSNPLEENGRMLHSGNWQHNFTSFLRRKVL